MEIRFSLPMVTQPARSEQRRGPGAAAGFTLAPEADGIILPPTTRRLTPFLAQYVAQEIAEPAAPCSATRRAAAAAYGVARPAPGVALHA